MKLATGLTKAVFCPQCGAASVEKTLTGEASCRVCDWRGRDYELAAMPFSNGFGGDEELSRAFFVDVRKLLGQTFGLEMGRLLLRWGFLPAPDVRLLSRYLAAAARAVVLSIFDEREKLEKELHGKPC
jgi:hypothetical protein